MSNSILITGIVFVDLENLALWKSFVGTTPYHVDVHAFHKIDFCMGVRTGLIRPHPHPSQTTPSYRPSTSIKGVNYFRENSGFGNTQNLIVHKSKNHDQTHFRDVQGKRRHCIWTLPEQHFLIDGWRSDLCYTTNHSLIDKWLVCDIIIYDMAIAQWNYNITTAHGSIDWARPGG